MVYDRDPMPASTSNDVRRNRLDRNILHALACTTLGMLLCSCLPHRCAHFVYSLVLCFLVAFLLSYCFRNGLDGYRAFGHLCCPGFYGGSSWGRWYHRCVLDVLIPGLFSVYVDVSSLFIHGSIWICGCCQRRDVQLSSLGFRPCILVK